MTEVVKKLAEEKGYDLVVDTSTALYFKPALDITAEAIAAYDKAYPVRSNLDIGEAMAGYLDQYGAGEERREKIIKTVGDLCRGRW